MLGDHLHALPSGEGGDGGVAAPLENGGKRGLNITLVVDDSDQGFGTHVWRLQPT